VSIPESVHWDDARGDEEAQKRLVVQKFESTLSRQRKMQPHAKS
jgi:hypothetical protein